MRIPVTKRMDSKRRVVLPKDAVDALRLEVGGEVVFSISKNRIIIAKKGIIY